jgi:hypothetical protein
MWTCFLDQNSLPKLSYQVMASIGLSSGIKGKELIKSQFWKGMHTENTNFPSSQEKEGVQNFKMKLAM